MSLYDIYLGRSNIEHLDEWFSESPYTLEGSGPSDRTASYIHPGTDETIAFMGYTHTRLVIFWGPIEDDGGLPQEVRADIAGKLKNLQVSDSGLFSDRRIVNGIVKKLER